LVKPGQRWSTLVKSTPTCHLEPHEHASHSRLPLCQARQVLRCCSLCDSRLLCISPLQLRNKAFKALPAPLGQQLVDHDLRDAQQQQQQQQTSTDIRNANGLQEAQEQG
jgi:hypothetical protein